MEHIKFTCTISLSAAMYIKKNKLNMNIKLKFLNISFVATFRPYIVFMAELATCVYILVMRRTINHCYCHWYSSESSLLAEVTGKGLLLLMISS